MRVALAARRDLIAAPGGDTVQIAQTAAELRRRGHRVDVITSSLRGRAGDYDLVHVFNLSRVHDTLVRSRECVAVGVPLVVSPIYHPPAWIDDYERRGRGGLAGEVTRRTSRDVREAGKALWHAARRPNQLGDAIAMCRAGYSASQIEVLSLASMVVCNSVTELVLLRSETGFIGPGGVSHLGLSPEFLESVRATAGAARRDRRGDGRPLLLCVGRLEPNKGQLDVVWVARRLGCDVILVGDESKMSPGYVRRVLDEGRKLDRFSHVRHVHQPDLVGIYRRASAHVLASWFETVSLVTLEAVACGCAAVAPERSYIRDYVDDECVYAPSGDRERLLRSVGLALDRRDQAQQESGRALAFTWEAAVDDLLEAYQELLNGVPGSADAGAGRHR